MEGENENIACKDSEAPQLRSSALLPPLLSSEGSLMLPFP